MRKAKKETSWDSVKKIIRTSAVSLGRYHSYHFHHTPRRLLHMMSYYKFASKMIGAGKTVLDVGCQEGLGTWLLASECGRATGIDSDSEAIQAGKKNWKGANISFRCVDFLKMKPAPYGAIVCFDTVEHILPRNTGKFFKKIPACLSHDGIAVIGTPNITSSKYASEVTRQGHVNLYSGERLEAEMKKHFHHVFMFAANDEMVHTGFLPMAQYLIAIGFHKRK